MWQGTKKNCLPWKEKGSLKVENTISIMNSDQKFSYKTDLFFQILINSVKTESIRPVSLQLEVPSQTHSRTTSDGIVSTM